MWYDPNNAPFPVYSEALSITSSQGGIYGSVYVDTTPDQVRDKNENGVVGAVVDLLSGSTVVSTTRTDSNGEYSFTGLNYGNYTVRRNSLSNIIGVTQQEVSLNVTGPLKTGINFGTRQVFSLGADVSNIQEGTAITFAIPSGSFIATPSYAWTVDGVSVGTNSPTLNYTFSDGGTRPSKFTIGVTVVGTPTLPGSSSGTFADSVDVFVANLAPSTPTFGTVAPISEGDNLSLTVASTDAGSDLLTYSWDINNDGVFGGPEDIASTSTSSVTVPWSKLTSLASGSTIRVRVTDEDGARAVSDGAVQITINNAAPIANARGPYSILAGQGSVLLNGSSSSDPGNDPLTYIWEVQAGSTWKQIAMGVTPTLTWSDLAASQVGVTVQGSYPLRVRVTDSDNSETISATTTLTVNNTAPVASLPNVTISEGQSLIIDGGTSADADGHSLNYLWDLDNDGQFDDGSGTTLNTTWAQLQSLGIVDGTTSGVAHTVRLQVDDGFGGVNVASASLTLQNSAPSAEMLALNEATEGTAVAVSFANAFDPSEPDVNAGLLYSIDLNNDGDYNDAGEVLDNSSPNISITFPDNGSYTIAGRVRDRDGASTTYSKVINVGNASPTGVITPGNVLIDEEARLLWLDWSSRRF